ncbi:hypothetical protein H0H92_005599 [Tricholoma furcatifolium]|nr:hypothetical protein H0H92_005599 [Tricholoma furcatifolium]
MLRQDIGHASFRYQLVSAYRSLQIAAGRRPLLPNIRYLHTSGLTGFRNELLSFVPLVMGPRLRRIDVAYPSSAPRERDHIELWRSFFSNLPRWCPSLESLSLYVGTENLIALGGVIDLELNDLMALSTAVMGLGQLRSLCIDVVMTTEVFVHLAQLPTLTNLDLRCADFVIPSALPSTAFQFLTSLTTGWTINLGTCIRILKLMGQTSVLESLSLECHDEPEDGVSTWRELIRTISTVCSVARQRDLSISDYYALTVPVGGDAAIPGRQIGSNELKPLLRFASLRELQLLAYHGFNLDDVFAKNMAIRIRDEEDEIEEELDRKWCLVETLTRTIAAVREQEIYRMPSSVPAGDALPR